MSDIVVSVENLSKEYRLGIINHGTLAHDLQSWWARVHGKEDPNRRIDSAFHQPDASALTPDRFWALNDVSFEVNRGEVLGIIGRNGAGKSTLLKILSQVTTPTKGVVRINGRIASLLEVGTGFHPELTGRENIFLNGAILGMSKAEIRHKLDEIIAFAEVERFIETPVKRYSSGMYVRLAFAVAAHLEPEILIVDEVLAVGDAQFQKKCLGKMEEVRKEGRTVLFVSHNMAAMQSLCSRGIVLTTGELSYNGPIVDSIHYYSEIGSCRKRAWKNTSGVNVNYIKIQSVDGVVTARSVVKIDTEFTTTYRLPNCYLNLVVEDSEKRTIIHTRTDLLGVYPSFDPGCHKIQLNFSRISLRSGVYTVWFRLYCNIDNIYEVADSDSVMFEVRGPQVGGLVDVSCDWSINGQPIHSMADAGQYQ